MICCGLATILQANFSQLPMWPAPIDDHVLRISMPHFSHFFHKDLIYIKAELKAGSYCSAASHTFCCVASEDDVSVTDGIQA